ncbi:diguanylate cyclase [Enterovibrio norvegicus]|uniref:putative bifunctional diguanylate cyclase/phosphodiesterase n=1 Tax=Enterovibrio norvegicus TaxID=188144 RepID=UPI000C838993|nr:bifunctional diguanylate cyclase/phosphodiesterase [Enterovibrio norvegicus]MCC4797262.1 bifunctional diguanylate cyclase/phosphodiesterase [Enterovibrio norvegicus]PMH72253.1 diguanylate cyclase [Enterovibrio norvegicus]PMI26989.1 diguanylate cyclase [Enterovibrio norvegicus]PMI40108.1 diguanylate cyclase [Enterovibrio norvegicus]PMN56133.1 diguanylate cyclase [Enterovibrio norvegicus]
MIKTFSIILVILGMLAIVSALRSSIALYQRDKRPSTFSFIPVMLGFVLGYLTFAAFLSMKPTTTPIEFIVSMIFFGGGIFCVMIFGVISQSMERIAFAEFQQHHNESHDPLTGLPNRRFLLRTISQQVNEFNLSEQHFALITFDINNFNNINEVFSHQKGDVLLAQFSERLKEFIDADIFLARSSGNRFTLIVNDPQDSNIPNYIESIQSYLDHPLTINEHDVNVTSTAGVSLFPEHGTSAEEVLKRSEIAMYSAKRIQAPYSIYEPSASSHFYDKTELASMLHTAVTTMDFDLYFQPVINVNNQNQMTLEVLLRWPLGDGYSVRPDEFIPIAEQTNAIKQITHWVLETMVTQLAAWRRQGITPQVQINLSVRDIEDDALETFLSSLMKKHPINPAQLTLEITETSMMQNPCKAQAVLEKIKKLGVYLSIDDFGTGFSSLSILSNMPIDEIKIDRSFVTDLLYSSNHEAIVRSTIYLAHSLECRVVAEGVETEALGQYLISIGCDKLQGYWYGRPMTLAQTDEWLQQATLTNTRVASQN